MALINGFASGSCLFLDIRPHRQFLDGSATPTPLPFHLPGLRGLYTPGRLKQPSTLGCNLHRTPLCLRARMTGFQFTEEKTEAGHG